MGAGKDERQKILNVVFFPFFFVKLPVVGLSSSIYPFLSLSLYLSLSHGYAITESHHQLQRKKREPVYEVDS